MPEKNHVSKLCIKFNTNYNWDDYVTFWTSLVSTVATMINTTYGGATGPDGLDIQQIKQKRDVSVLDRRYKKRTGEWHVDMKYNITYLRADDMQAALDRLNESIKNEYKSALQSSPRFRYLKLHWDNSIGSQED